MTHEPECPMTECDHEEPVNSFEDDKCWCYCCCCEIRSAYQRGRDDERKAIQYDLILGPARRDGEQE